MRSEAQIALVEKINEANARIRTLGTWERERAVEIQHLIRQQSVLFDQVCELEIKLAVQKSDDAKAVASGH